MFQVKLQRLPDQFECKLEALDCGVTHNIGLRKGGHLDQAGGRIQDCSLTFGKAFSSHKIAVCQHELFVPVVRLSNQIFERIDVTLLKTECFDWHRTKCFFTKLPERIKVDPEIVLCAPLFEENLSVRSVRGDFGNVQSTFPAPGRILKRSLRGDV